MALHLIKLCVGCDSVDDLKGWIRERLRDKKVRGLPREHVHTTRMAPKRCDELLAGGSLFWVIRGELICRQRLKDLRVVRGRDGIQRCELVLAPTVILVQPRAWRPFQGWRYLPHADAPTDLDRAARGAKAMPEPLRRELRELGLL
ncbi:MAG: hypothetical protein QOD74_405 [Variibacter sp.]|jgi:hypothetical protein|nr:hypothetical protein [Variibacter sp.]